MKATYAIRLYYWTMESTICTVLADTSFLGNVLDLTFTSVTILQSGASLPLHLKNLMAFGQTETIGHPRFINTTVENGRQEYLEGVVNQVLLS